MILSDIKKEYLLIQIKMGILFFITGCFDQFNILNFLPAQPFLSFLILYIWVFFLRSYASLALIFFLGMLIDLMGGAFLGENTLMFLLLWGGISFYQEYYSKDLSREWPMLWVCLVTMGIFQWVLIMLIHQSFVWPLYHFMNSVVTILFYPWVKRGIKFVLKKEFSS